MSAISRRCSRCAPGRCRPAAVRISAEAAEEGVDYLLRNTNRYAHSVSYIRDLAAKSGFAEVSMEEVMLRKHKGEPVQGYIYVLRRAPAGEFSVGG